MNRSTPFGASSDGRSDGVSRRSPKSVLVGDGAAAEVGCARCHPLARSEAMKNAVSPTSASDLRRKLGKKIITTVRGLGYRLGGADHP
jgi:hypothetical protein